MPITTILTSTGSGLDTYGYYTNASEHGSETTMLHKNQNTHQPIAKFDVSSLAGHTVLGVRFRIYMEAGGSYVNYPRLDQINDAFYNAYTESDIYNWTAHAPTVIQIGQINVSTTEGWKEWNSASLPDLITAVQNWIDGIVSNNGFLLATTAETVADNGGRQYRTKEYGDGTYAPQLIIEYIKYNERGRIQTVLATAAKINEAQAQNEQGKTQTIPVVADGTDTQAMTDAGRIQAAVTTAGEHDAYISAEQERLTVGLAITAELVHHIIRGEAGRLVATAMVLGGTDTQAMLDTGKILTANMVNGRSFGETQTMVETGALLLMKAWIVSRFPWAFSEVDLKTATFSERRNINT